MHTYIVIYLRNLYTYIFKKQQAERALSFQTQLRNPKNWEVPLRVRSQALTGTEHLSSK